MVPGAPAPIPISNLPFEMWSIVIACLAKTAGCRNGIDDTNVPILIIEVQFANAARVVQPSNQGPDGFA